MKIYTKTGDRGKTSLFGGKIVSKDDLRIEAYGTVDELNSVIALVVTHISDDSIKSQLNSIQHLLFNVGSNLAMDPENPFDLDSVTVEDVSTLETQMDLWNESLPQLTNFILPGGSKEASFAHQARTVCRRAERRVVALANLEKVDEILIIYLNRLSDYMFVLSRWLNYSINVEEVIWKSR